MAWLYIPAVKQLLEYARTVEEMRGALLVRSGSSGISVGANGCLPEHSTAEDLLLGHAYELPSPSSPPQSYGDGDKDDARTKVRRFEPLDATAQPDGLTFQGIRYPMEVVRRAQELCLKKGWEDPSLLLVALEAMEHVSSGGAAASGQHKDSSLEVRKGAVRADITRLTKTLANLLQQAGQGGEGNLYLRLRQQLKGPEGSATERATLSELEQQRRRLSTVVQEGWRALRQGDYAAWVQRVEAGF